MYIRGGFLIRLNMNFKFEPVIKEKAPAYRLIAVEANVESPETDDKLWSELTAFSDSYRACHEMADVNKRPGIDATRRAYKAFGKEPNRYRPSTEALCRRMVKGLELYRTLALIDLVNLLSVSCGHSIGGFDADKIEGDTLTLGVGREGEPYEAIGRGPLNIAGLPVWRDAVGGIGTPTSDNERTKMSPSTRRLLLTINVYGDDMPDADIMALTTRLLETYACATDIKFSVHKP